MSDRYYVQISRRAFGPFSSEELQEMIAQGRIESATLLSLDKQTWKQAGAFPGLFSNVVNSETQGVGRQTQSEPTPSSLQKKNDAREWFISVDGRESFGPFTTNELVDDFRARKISSETLVWRQGDENSRKLEDVEEIRSEIESFQSAQDSFASKRQTTNERRPQEADDLRKKGASKEDAAAPRRNAGRFAAKIKTRFVSTWICLGVTTTSSIIAFVFQRRGIVSLSLVDFTLGSFVCLFAGLALLGAVVFGAAFLHAFWSAIPKEIARANPNEAVAFVFVPGFGIYWIFQALQGGAVDANEALKQYGVSGEIDEKNALFVSPGWALATSVFFDLGGPFNPISGFFFLLSLGVTTVQMKNVAIKLESLNAARS